MKKPAWDFPSAPSWTALHLSSPNCRSHSSLTSWGRCAPPTTLLLWCQDAGSIRPAPWQSQRRHRKNRTRRRKTQWRKIHPQDLTALVRQALHIDTHTAQTATHMDWHISSTVGSKVPHRLQMGNKSLFIVPSSSYLLLVSIFYCNHA